MSRKSTEQNIVVEAATDAEQNMTQAETSSAEQNVTQTAGSADNATKNVTPKDKNQRKDRAVRLFSTKGITRTAIFSALAVVLYYYVKFPVPAIFPSFLDIQFSDLPALLAGFMMGPLAGAIVIIIKCLVKLPMSGTSGVGELVDLIIGLAFVLTSTIIYRRKRNLKGALLSLAVGSIACTIAAAFANRFIAVPAYLELMFNGDWKYLLGAMNAIFDGKVTESNFYSYYIFLSVIPFNLLRCLIVSILTFLLYKNLKKLFDRLSI